MMRPKAFLVPALAGFLLLAPARAQDGARAPVPDPGRLPGLQEPRSEIVFAPTFRGAGAREVHTLTGIGLRTKTIFSVKVYAVGFYVDAARACWALAPWKGRSLEQLRKDESFYKALLQDDFGKTMRMVFTRDVDGEDIREAFEDEIGPRVEEARLKKGWKGGAKALEKFKKYFSIDELKEGTELVISWQPGGRLGTRLSGKELPVIRNLALSWSLFQGFLGKDPIEPSAKLGFVERFPALLAYPYPKPKPIEPAQAADAALKHLEGGRD